MAESTGEPKSSPSGPSPSPEPKAHRISAEFFSKHGNKSDKIVNAPDQNSSVEGKSRWYNFDFTESLYLTRIEVNCQGYSNFDKFEIEVDHIDGSKHQERVSVEDNIVTLRLGKLSRGLRFKPDTKYFSDTQIVNLSVHGFTLNEFYRFELSIREFEKRQDDLKRREDKLAAASEEIETLQSEKASLESEIGKSRAEAEQLAKSNAAAKQRSEETSAKLVQSQSEFRQQLDRVNEVRLEISDKEASLESLTRELRLFPSEIAGFIREGNRSTVWYSLMGAPFALILGAVMLSLFWSAADLTIVWKTEPDSDIWTIFVSRLPFVFIAITLVEACSYTVGRLVFEVIRINRQRLDFAKLSIVAKDVSTVSAQNTELADDELYELETKLKMELLREHMKNYTGAEFEYRGSAIIAALAGVAERLGGKKSE